jgi:hypothetical protein
MISKDFVALAHARGWSKSAVPFLLFNEAIEALGLTTTIQQLKP